MIEELAIDELWELRSKSKLWLKENGWSSHNRPSDYDIEGLVEAGEIERELNRRARESISKT